MNKAGAGLYQDKQQIISIVRRSLGYIDHRLMEHGERVAYIARKIVQAGGGLSIDMEKLLILCLFHDIGAYKTEEIDDMVNFETKNVVSHAAYGCVFLQNVTPLGEMAKAILYHHTDYRRLEAENAPYKLEGELIFLADRVDILLNTRGVASLPALQAMGGITFSPELVGLFYEAESVFGVSGHLLDGSYISEVEEAIYGLEMRAEDVMSYLRMLVYSIDFRSPHTVTHTANTVAISNALTRLLGLGEAERQAVSTGAFLHDIGKIAIPYFILENPGRLTGEEMEIMRTHVSSGEEILRGVVSDEICDIAVRHHEKLNGKGYCRGLGGDDLTLPQRIVAVADVLSALIGKRSYKEPFSKEKTLSILRDMSNGGELCPKVCAAAVENYDYIMQVTALADDPVVELYDTLTKQYAEYCALLSE